MHEVCYHRTCMDTQLSKFWRLMPPEPCRSSPVASYEAAVSSERVAPNACSRPPTARFIKGVLPAKVPYLRGALLAWRRLMRGSLGRYL